jgi:hypothetical protein
MDELVKRMSEVLPWITVERGGIKDGGFRQEHSIPSESLFFLAAPNRVLVIFPEGELNWTVITFNTNPYLDLFFSSRYTKPRAPFAVLAFVLAEMLECMETNLKALVANFPDDKDAISKLSKEIKSVALAIKTENEEPVEIERFNLSDFAD